MQALGYTTRSGYSTQSRFCGKRKSLASTFLWIHTKMLYVGFQSMHRVWPF